MIKNKLAEVIADKLKSDLEKSMREETKEKAMKFLSNKNNYRDFIRNKRNKRNKFVKK